jgi:small-conductance mechanosensitive channel
VAVLVVKGRPMAMVKAPDGKSYPVKIGNEIGRYEGKVVNIDTKVTKRDRFGKRIEKSPDRIVVEETVYDNFTGKRSVEYRYLTM